jgi:hypothetical protein
MQQDLALKKSERQIGVIDSIADGLTLALARPLLLIVPMLLDFYFWVGWRATPQPLSTPLRKWVIAQDQQNSADIAARLESLGRSDVTQLLAAFTPSLLAGAKRSDIYVLRDRPEFEAMNWGVSVLMLLSFVLAAVLIMMIFSVPLADAAIDRTRSIPATLLAIGRGTLRALGLHLLALGIAILLIGPTVISWLVLLIVGVDALWLVGLALLAAALTGFVVWWFALKAIVVSDVGPLTALYYSVSVVRAYFWQTLGFTAAWLLITLGLGELWLQIADTAPGLLLGVVANAFFAAGITIAGMIFYESRIQSLVPRLSR